MDIKAYITSGKLEAYWMGELTNEEMLEVDVMADQYPLIKQELEACREGINNYAQAGGLQPKKEILQNVLAASEEKSSSKPIIDNEEKRITENVGTDSISIWSVAASILLLLSIGLNILFFNNWKSSQKQLLSLSQEMNLLADQVKTTNQELDYASLRIAHFLNKDNIHVRMEGMDVSPNSFANVFWNKKTNGVFISVDNLPAPPHGHQYQLWAIKSGQPPIDAGVFEHHQRIQELKTIKGDVIAFAVTLEKEGGTQHATVENTYVKGLLKKS